VIPQPQLLHGGDKYRGGRKGHNISRFMGVLLRNSGVELSGDTTSPVTSRWWY
jgi:hypothetical protein